MTLCERRGDHTQRPGSGKSDSQDDEEGRTLRDVVSLGEKICIPVAAFQLSSKRLSPWSRLSRHASGGTTLKDMAAAGATPTTMRKAEPTKSEVVRSDTQRPGSGKSDSQDDEEGRTLRDVVAQARRCKATKDAWYKHTSIT